MPERTPAGDRLARIRELVAGSAPVLQISSDIEGLHLEAVSMDPGEPEVLALVPATCPASNRELLLKHVEIPADLIRMIDAAAKLDRRRRTEIERLQLELEARGGRPTKNYAAQCAMKCSEPAFKAFIEVRHALARPLTDERVAARVRSVLAISSRTDLNTSSEAAARWRAMVVDFDAWRKR
ncbi:hypothetical protein [Martelella soudanensis]|uniref:hypothetical protein n=1 Tax=unclassified Martelella TaxID=2629616 RepID=UPI0015DEE12C|nr:MULTISPECIES: hypothetical protein [unclassified Martelella]